MQKVTAMIKNLLASLQSKRGGSASGSSTKK